MTTKQRFTLALGLIAASTGGYFFYKKKKPNFKILECNQQQKTVKWQYGQVTNIAKAGQQDTYSSSPNSDFFVNVGPVLQEGQVVGVQFNFLGKDDREAKQIYFN